MPPKARPIPENFAERARSGATSPELEQEFGVGSSTIKVWRHRTGTRWSDLGVTRVRSENAGLGDTGRDELGALRAKIATYEALVKQRTAYPSGLQHNHREFFKGEIIRFGLVSDTHLASSLVRIDDLHSAYEILRREGIKVVYSPGDLVAGVRVYPGQENELVVWGMDNQVNYLAEHYPRVKDISTYFVCGNHDLSFLRSVGVDIGSVIAERREDMIYLGQIESDIVLAEGVTMKLWHGGGGSAYALSYRGQRLINSLEGGTKPNIIASGHYHNDFYMMYRNIHFVQCGCFERQTLWLKRAGLQPSCSFWIIECHVKDGSVNRFRPELVTFY